MIEKVRFVEPIESDVSPTHTYADFSPLSAYPFSPTPKAFKPTQETWKLWTRTPKETRQLLEKQFRFNHLYQRLHGSKHGSKPHDNEKVVLNITDAFQYRVDGLLDEDDYLPTANTNNLLNPKSLSPQLSFQMKAPDQNPQSINSLAKLESSDKDSNKIRRKSDISSWSGGISCLETRTVFLAYQPPRMVALKNRNHIDGEKHQNSGRKRGVTTLELPKKSPKLVSQKSFSTFKDKSVEKLHLPGRGSISGVVALENMRTPKKETKEEPKQNNVKPAQETKPECLLEKQENRKIIEDEDSEEIDIPIDDEESEIMEDDKAIIPVAQIIKKKTPNKKRKKVETHSIKGSSLLQQLKPKVLPSFKSSSVSRKRPLAPMTPSLRCMTGESFDIKSEYNHLEISKPEALQPPKFTSKSPYKSNPTILQNIQKKLIRNFSNQLQSTPNYQSVSTINNLVPSTTLAVNRHTSLQRNMNAEPNRMLNEKRVHVAQSGHGFHFPSNSVSMNKSQAKESQLPSLGVSSSEHKRLTSLRQAQRAGNGLGNAQDSFPGIKERSLKQKDNQSVSKLKVQEIMSAYGTFFAK